MMYVVVHIPKLSILHLLQKNLSLKLNNPTSISSVRSQFLSMRCITIYNYLSDETYVSLLKNISRNKNIQLNHIFFRLIIVTLFI